MPRRRSLESWAPIPCATCTGQPQERITLPSCADLGPVQVEAWTPTLRTGSEKAEQRGSLLFLLLRLQLVDQLMLRVYSQRILTFQSWEGK